MRCWTAARATASSVLAQRELWTVMCTALEITAAQECERVFDFSRVHKCVDGQYPATKTRRGPKRLIASIHTSPQFFCREWHKVSQGPQRSA